MKFLILKRARVIISALVLVLFSLFFIDFRHVIPVPVMNTTLYLQFVPSVLKFIKLLSLGAAGFLFILVLTFLFGRVYCSTLCPLGILQDVFSAISRWFKPRKKRRYRFSEPYPWIRYGLLVITLIMALLGSTLLVNLLDPYSNFGRICTYFVKPVVVEGNNLLANALESRKIFTIFKYDLVSIHWELLLIALLVLAVVAWFSFRRGRLYCNTICPVGSLLGMVSKFSLVKIRIDKENCTKCGLCIHACKSECIDIKNGSVDFSRCVACYNCLAACPDSAAKYDTRLGILPGKRVFQPVREQAVKQETEEGTDTGKRKLILGSIALLLGTMGISMAQKVPVPKKASTVPEKKNCPVSPPGSSGITPFQDLCTACTLCVSICPTQVLQPSFLEYGLAGLMQPHMDYHAGYCNYECIMCMEVCPTGALLPVTLEKKKTIQMGKSVFVKDNCIVHTEKTDCGACSERCPTKAVHMVPYEGSLVIPEVNNEICTGCGACEFACPTVPYKAIFVDGNPSHLVAKMPEKQEKSTIELKEEFPF